MNPHDTSTELHSNEPGCLASDITVAQLVGQVYEDAPTSERRHLLAYLLRPLGVLSLVGVANGIFAKILFRSGRQDWSIRLDDTQNVSASDVIALVNYVQQLSAEALDGLTQMLAASPLMAYSSAAALLVSVLLQRAHTRRVGNGHGDDQPMA